MARPKSKIACIESLTIGTCTVALTLDGRYRSADGTYLCSIRFTMNRGRYYYHLGDRYTADEFDAIDKSDGRGRGGNQGQNYTERCRLVEIYNRFTDIVRDMSNKGTLKSIDNIKAVLTGRVSTYGNDSKDIYANTFIGLWNEIIAQKKASTAETYRNARDCFINLNFRLICSDNTHSKANYL